MFKVGDRVEVIDSGHMYSRYVNWFAKQELPLKSKYGHHRKELKNGMIAKIIYMNMHLSDDIMLYVLEAGNGDIFLVNEKAIKLVKPLPDTIKITKWEELDGIQNNDCRIELSHNVMDIGIICIEYKKIETDKLISILSACGFSVEFIPEIKLSEKDWHMARALDDGWVARDMQGKIFWGKDKPKRQHGYWAVSDFMDLPNDRFPFITFESEPVAVSDLQKMERE